VLKINDQFGIDEAARDRAYFRKVLDEEGTGGARGHQEPEHRAAVTGNRET
jgi:hypothetical protein